MLINLVIVWGWIPTKDRDANRTEEQQKKKTIENANTHIEPTNHWHLAYSAQYTRINE